MIITFTDTSKEVIPEFYPTPGKQLVPDWYKNLESYLNGKKQPDGKGSATETIKKCMPVFDAITCGYIIYSPADVFVSQKVIDPKVSEKTETWYEWRSFNLIDFHPVSQAPTHPQRTSSDSYPKWMNPWSIKTPPGYSVLFTTPMHRESVFTILDGIVDTDTYTAPVNFPFVLKDEKFEGLIPAGTPIAQVIPFKRDAWEMQIGNEEDFKDQLKVNSKLRTRFFDSYKNQFRQIKEYK